MFRTHNCGELRAANIGEQVTLSGWVQRSRDKGGMLWVDLRDRWGVTQLSFEEGKTASQILDKARELGREFVIQATGEVIQRESMNDKMPTGEVEIFVSDLTILNSSHIPPFKIEDETDGGEDLRMKYRYLDLRRNPVREKLQLRHKMMRAVRDYLDQKEFIEVETPVLIKSTPEGARDFVVPSRLNKGEFYALPQSPQTFKQLLMVSGFDRYFQIVKCFRDEDLRADRQPEFTQIDCEMAFIEQEDILNLFEGMTKYLFKNVKGVEIEDFQRMEYADAMRLYGSDKPDIRFGMEFVELNDVAKEKGFKVFDEAELVVGIRVPGCASYTRKQLDGLTNFVKTPQVGAKGLVYVKCNEDGSFKSSVDKFFTQEQLAEWAKKSEAQPGDLLLVLSGDTGKVRNQMNVLRLKMGDELGLRKPEEYKPLWVVNFPLLEWDEESKRFHAMHHPFTSPKAEDIPLLDTNPGDVRANAYDLVINGVEIGGGSIRIHDKSTQALMFKHLGFTEEEAKEQFGFLMEAFEYGAPPHGGIAFGFDRLCAMFGGTESIRDYIAFPKNTSGRDVMIDAPSAVDDVQLQDLGIIKIEE
ncbi:aspartate--tRNA ligase [Aureibacter tunicatorum]|uniref:Aspartate--tRNA ligase n=1 Tax=Aureibacter tunicatorum TaxID=866807 RepID=A0AAE3XQE8_9BACT|nr:aspartate--tRNA ligase [Aureibacter tunicatorum]MDR6240173.1 aspartyl-tRNA synthetase [Aureibacter tunicatorum]BDD05946.1 aspartate--tRNA ligase [Aureibacter tunicatorum]